MNFGLQNVSINRGSVTLTHTPTTQLTDVCHRSAIVDNKKHVKTLLSVTHLVTQRNEQLEKTLYINIYISVYRQV